MTLSELAFAYNIEIIDKNFNAIGLIDMSKSNGKTAILSIVTDIPGIYDIGAVFVNESGKWLRLPDTINCGNSKFPIVISPSSSINFDSLGAIWVSGNQLLKFSNDRWQAIFVDDSDKTWRTYQQFCIDKFNNLWVATKVYHDTFAQYSELLKFDGKKFETVLKFDGNPFSFLRRGTNVYSNGIAALSDGRVVVHRTLDIHDADVKNGKTEDLYFINQDLSYQRVKLQTPSGSDFDNYNHIVSSIFPETDGKIWFCLDYEMLSDTFQTTCCSGLELLENDVWTALDSKYGFEKVKAYPKEVYKAIYRMLRLNKDDFLLLSEDNLYKFSYINRLEKKEWLEVLNTPCKFLIPNSQWKASDVDAYLKNLYAATGPIIIGGMVLQENGEIWLQLANGILIFNKSIVAGIDYHSTDNPSTIYPNPATEILKIRTNSNYSDYQVINILGSKVKEGFIIDNQIRISDLPNGMYFIKLSMYGTDFIIESFFKN